MKPIQQVRHIKLKKDQVQAMSFLMRKAQEKPFYKQLLLNAYHKNITVDIRTCMRYANGCDERHREMLFTAMSLVFDFMCLGIETHEFCGEGFIENLKQQHEEEDR